MKNLLMLTIFMAVGWMTSVKAQSNKYPGLKIDFRNQIDESDLIIVGELRHLPLPEEVLGIACYEIVPEKILKPSLNVKGLIEEMRLSAVNRGLKSEGKVLFYIDNNVQASIGSPPKLQSGLRYIYFLKRAKDTPIWKDKHVFMLVNSWKGVVPIESTSENRVLAGVLDAYGVNILQNKKAFIDALYSAINGTDVVGESADVKTKLKLN